MMTDHNDDTILDEELDENDFNFDNENEDALLAENDYDFMEKSKVDDNYREQLEHEEDVLDIGIADEDIVDSETTCLQETTNIENETGEYLKPKFPNGKESAGTQKKSDTKLETFVDDKEFDHNEQGATSSITDDEVKCGIENEFDQRKDEKLLKSTVISLKKSIRKSYDNVPDLAKVIELVQPGVSTSRSRKQSRDFHSNIRKKQHISQQKHKYDYDDRKRSEYRRHNRERVPDYEVKECSYRSDEDNKNSIIPLNYTNNENYHEPNRESIPFTSSFEVQSEPHFNQNVSSSVGSKHEISVEQPILASVQITQERYQITSDFQVIHSSQNTFVPSTNEVKFDRSLPEFIQKPYSAESTSPGIRLMPPPQQLPFRFEPRLTPRSLSPQNAFPRPMLLMGQRPQHPPCPSPSLPPHPQNQVRSILVRPPLNGPPQTQLMPPQILHPNGGPPLTQPQHLNHPSPQLRPPIMQQITRPEQLRPLSHPDFHRTPIIRMPFHGERNPTVMIRHSQHIVQIPSMQNVRPLENSSRMPVSFRPNIPPPRLPQPQFMVRGPREQMSLTNKYYEEQRQYTPDRTVPVSFPSHINQIPHYPSSMPTQPPPPGCPSNQQMRPVFPPGEIRLQRPNEINYSQYNQQEYFVNQAVQQHKPVENYFMNDNSNQLKRNNSSSISGGPSKQARYYTNVKEGGVMRNLYEISTTGSLPEMITSSMEIQVPHAQDEDEDMKLYRKKVESQKKLREKFVQMKEEQRLKNQMQSFIQSNIKGILQKREQFLRKTEAEQVEKNRLALRRTENTQFAGTDTSQSGSHTYISDDRGRNRTISRKRYDEREQSEEKYHISATENNINPLKVHRNENVIKNSELEADSSERELHKVLKIKYRDGTVALKSIPVHRTGSVITMSHTINTGKIPKKDNLNIIVNEKESSGNANINQRRMVVSKHIPTANVKNELWNENIIVESIRKGITQSSIPLAQRFSNLRAASNDDKNEIINGTKAKNRLVISEEDKSRTGWPKNKTSDLTTSLIQKMANM